MYIVYVYFICISYYLYYDDHKYMKYLCPKHVFEYHRIFLINIFKKYKCVILQSISI